MNKEKIKKLLTTLVFFLKWFFAFSIKASLKFLKTAEISEEQFALLEQAYLQQKEKQSKITK